MRSINKITVKRVERGEKWGGDIVYAEIYKNDNLVAEIFYNHYLNIIRGVCLELANKNNNNPKAYYYSDNNQDFEKQIDDAIFNMIYIIGNLDKNCSKRNFKKKLRKLTSHHFYFLTRDGKKQKPVIGDLYLNTEYQLTKKFPFIKRENQLYQYVDDIWVKIHDGDYLINKQK